MKTLYCTVICILFSIYSFSQTCDSLVKTQVDKYSKKSFTFTSRVTARGENSFISLQAMLTTNGKAVILTFSFSPISGCVDKKDKIDLLFTDGTSLALIHESSYSCDNTATTYFLSSYGKKNALSLLKAKPLSGLRITTKHDSIAADLSAADATHFMQAMACLTDNL